jgi:hypothetical protein
MAIDALAERYGQLPSKLAREATTFDLFIFNAANDYRALLQRRANGEPDPIPLEVLLKKKEEYDGHNKGHNKK